jgi:hypothetical protein
MTKINTTKTEHPMHKTQGEDNNIFVIQNRISSHLYQKPIN